MTRRGIITAVAALVIVAGVIAYAAIPSRHLYEPEVQIQQEDYALARRHFQTRLTRIAGSPQRDVFALPVPDYVDVVERARGRPGGVVQWMGLTTLPLRTGKR